MNSDMTLASGNLRIVRLGIDGRAALSEQLVAAIAAACDDLEDGKLPAVLRLHIRGGKDAGEAWPGDVNVSVLHHWEQVLHRLERLQGVTVAVASGACGGAALELLLAADHRVAVPAFWLSVMSSEGASWPSMAVYRMVRRHGPSAARKLCMFTTRLQAADALELGVVDEIAPNAQQSADEFIAALAKFDVSALAARRLLIAESTLGSYEDRIGSHLAACDLELRRRRAMSASLSEPCGVQPPQGMHHASVA